MGNQFSMLRNLLVGLIVLTLGFFFVGNLCADTLPKSVTLIAPAGINKDKTTTFIWIEDTNATWYKLLVWDSSEEPVHAQWYASNICFDGNCLITLESELFDNSETDFNNTTHYYGSGLTSIVDQFQDRSKIVFG